MTKDYKLGNLEKVVAGLRKDNRGFMEKIEELQATVFGKERLIDKLRHQLKHGVVAEKISGTFDHGHEGPGGSISTGKLVSKVELADKQQREFLSKAQQDQLKWRESSRTLIRLASRFLASLRELGAAS